MVLRNLGRLEDPPPIYAAPSLEVTRQLLDAC